MVNAGKPAEKIDEIAPPSVLFNQYISSRSFLSTSSPAQRPTDWGSVQCDAERSNEQLRMRIDPTNRYFSSTFQCLVWFWNQRKCNSVANIVIQHIDT